ncbi:hypothetical protein [Paraglaciecola sp.]
MARIFDELGLMAGMSDNLYWASSFEKVYAALTEHLFRSPASR